MQALFCCCCSSSSSSEGQNPPVDRSPGRTEQNNTHSERERDEVREKEQNSEANKPTHKQTKLKKKRKKHALLTYSPLFPHPRLQSIRNEDGRHRSCPIPTRPPPPPAPGVISLFLLLLGLRAVS
jgi:hypothetical protein